MKESCSPCDNMLGYQGVGGGYRLQDNYFSEIWVLKLGFTCLIKLDFTHKFPNFTEASSRIPDFSYGLCSIFRAEAVNKSWAKPKQKFGQVLVNCFQIIIVLTLKYN